MTDRPRIGDRFSYDGALCTVRYIGTVEGTKGSWLGVEWDDPTRGKHDGQYKGKRYFECQLKSPTSASFIRPTRQDDGKTDFLHALHEKYATPDSGSGAPHKQVVFGTKVAQEVGFDKIAREQSQLHELRIVILDGLKLAQAYSMVEQGGAGLDRSIRDVCPKVVELDLSRNLFTSFRPVVKICAELDDLRSLKVNGNRFTSFSPSDLEGSESAFRGIKELGLDETLLSWETIVLIASHFPDLTTLYASNNQLTAITPIPPSPLLTTLTTLHLEYNHFTSIVNLSVATVLSSLRALHLKGNRIACIHNCHFPKHCFKPIFSSTLHYVDLSSNAVADWFTIDQLQSCFPGLASLRISHNPIYDHPDLDDQTSSTAPSTATTTTVTSSTEESYMLLAARLPGLKTINFSFITPQDRTNAEAFYLSRIAKQMAAVKPGEEDRIIRAHPRYHELCETYGAPVVNRRKEVDPRFLEGRLVTVRFLIKGKEKRAKVPKGFDLYAVKGIVGRLFDENPFKIQLVWETGEWDPVGGFDEAGDESDDEEERAVEEQKDDTGVADGEVPKGGRWVKREVELKDGPRLFGYCVDGMEPTVRVEVCG